MIIASPYFFSESILDSSSCILSAITMVVLISETTLMKILTSKDGWPPKKKSMPSSYATDDVTKTEVIARMTQPIKVKHRRHFSTLEVIPVVESTVEVTPRISQPSSKVKHRIPSYTPEVIPRTESTAEVTRKTTHLSSKVNHRRHSSTLEVIPVAESTTEVTPRITQPTSTFKHRRHSSTLEVIPVVESTTEVTSRIPLALRISSSNPRITPAEQSSEDDASGTQVFSTRLISTPSSQTKNLTTTLRQHGFDVVPSDSTLPQNRHTICPAAGVCYNTLDQCCFDVGPPSTTLAQHRNRISSASSVCLAHVLPVLSPPPPSPKNPPKNPPSPKCPPSPKNLPSNKNPSSPKNPTLSKNPTSERLSENAVDITELLSHLTDTTLLSPLPNAALLPPLRNAALLSPLPSAVLLSPLSNAALLSPLSNAALLSPLPVSADISSVSYILKTFCHVQMLTPLPPSPQEQRKIIFPHHVENPQSICRQLIF